MDQIRATLRIKGRVQGVFFRQSAKLEAVRLGLTGRLTCGVSHMVSSVGGRTTITSPAGVTAVARVVRAVPARRC